MTPGARYQAVIDILDAARLHGFVTEQAFLRWSRGARFAGSKDRAAIRDILFDVIRAKRSCSVLGGGESGRALVLGLLRLQDVRPECVFSGEGYAPSVLSQDEANRNITVQHPVLDAPEWMEPMLRQSLGSQFEDYAQWLRNRAPVFLRVNTLKADVAQAASALKKDGISASPHETVAGALTVVSGERLLTRCSAYQTGLVELQDASSQALINDLPLSTSARVLDYCAGGGGKSLAIAACTKAVVDAYDSSIDRMKDLPIRAKRAGAQISIITQPIGKYDLVLCDVPCSGSGTWRRAPDAKWHFSRSRLEELVNIQFNILTKAAKFSAPDGFLAYSTCSVMTQENEEIVNRFMSHCEKWKIVHQRRWPCSNLGDGFFLTVFKV